ncbi:MAG: cation diffusion facilitator family transporter [Acidimicrobiia bacterium]|nr:cation diffusion facilitator family transporter [Acidimicrobiia bacterium]
MSGGHDHGHAPSGQRAGARYRRRLAVSFVLVAVFFVVQAVGGVLTNSLALISDAAHMLTDVVGLGMALAAIQLASRHQRRAAQGDAADHHTFGWYRLEILAAFVNALLLFGVAGYVLYEAVRRFGGDAEVLGGPMLVIAVLGLAVNLVAFGLLRKGAEESLNVRGAYLEVLADTLGSVGVIVAAVLLELFGWTWVDPAVAVLIGIWILPRTYQLARQAVRILLQSAPPDFDLDRLREDLCGVEGVVDIHDLHVWTLTSEMESASVHLVIRSGTDTHGVLDRARQLLQERYDIEHATLQVEPDDHRGCEEIGW